MNIENEKKWFVYIGDHHEGPFSANEVNDKINSGLIHNDSYVWCEGMNDWVMLSDALDLTTELKKIQTKLPPGKPKAFRFGGDASKLPFYLGVSAVGLIFLAFGTLSILSRFSSEGLHARLRPVLNQVVDHAPFLSFLFHMVPNLQDISMDEQKELEQARDTSPDAGAKIAIASSQNDMNRPVFYLSTNLPTKTKFDIYLIGNSETLLNRLQYVGQNAVTTSRGFGKSEVFLADGGQVIPKGEYQVIVTESADQEEAVKAQLANFTPIKPTSVIGEPVPANARFTFSKTYFLGGSRDEMYLTRLKQFHEKIKQNAEREVQELKQYTDTLVSQFTALTTEFNRIYQSKKTSGGTTVAWKKDSETWKQINGQLEQTIQTWSKETIQNEFFYGKAYSLVKSAYESIKTLFALEDSYVEKPVDHATFDVQHGKTLSETRDSLDLLRGKMDLILKAPKSPSGLPTREGL